MVFIFEAFFSFLLIAKECMTLTVNCQVGCWEASQTCTKKVIMNSVLPILRELRENT